MAGEQPSVRFMQRPESSTVCATSHCSACVPHVCIRVTSRGLWYASEGQGSAASKHASLPSQVSSDGQPHLLASHNLRAQLKRSLSATEVRLLCLAGAPAGDRKCQLVAVLAASTPSSSSNAEQVTCNLLSHSADDPAHVAPALQQKAQTLEHISAAAPGTHVPSPQLVGSVGPVFLNGAWKGHSRVTLPSTKSRACDRLTVFAVEPTCAGDWQLLVADQVLAVLTERPAAAKLSHHTIDRCRSFPVLVARPDPGGMVS